jgi:hypothetical protein
MAGPLTVIFSKIQKRVFKLKAAELRGLSLEVVLGTAWVKYRIAQLESPEAGDAGLLGKNAAERLSSSIVKACQEVGPYLEAQERKAGVWMDSDGELLISGNELWRPSDGSVMEHGIHGGYVYPAVKCSGFDIHTPVARPEEVQRVLDAFRSFEWSTPMAAEIVLGCRFVVGEELRELRASRDADLGAGLVFDACHGASSRKFLELGIGKYRWHDANIFSRRRYRAYHRFTTKDPLASPTTNPVSG